MSFQYLANSIMLKISLLLLAIGLGCWIAFVFIGSTVDSEGVLHEPFGLIPLGWLFVALGCMVALAHVLRQLLKKSQ